MIVLVDHNMEGHAKLLWRTLASAGWLELAPVQLVTFAEAGVPADSVDRAVWRFAQERQMFLLTDNRNMEGDDSLERTIREELTPESLPVLTVSNRDRLNEQKYRARCAERLLEVVLYPERYLGTGRIFIP